MYKFTHQTIVKHCSVEIIVICLGCSIENCSSIKLRDENTIDLDPLPH